MKLRVHEITNILPTGRGGKFGGCESGRGGMCNRKVVFYIWDVISLQQNKLEL